MTTTFVFLRHGFATHNEAALIHGSAAYYDPAYTDATLTDKGVIQAFEARKAVADTGPWDATFCSPLLRCRQTLRAALPSVESAKIYLDDRLIEPQGVACNRRASRGVIACDVPEAWDLRKVDHTNPWDRWSVEAGTPTKSRHFANRVRHFTEEVLRFWPGKRVLICGHWEWIHTWFREFKGVEMDIPNCGVVTVELAAAEAQKIDGGKAPVEGDNDVPECRTV